MTCLTIIFAIVDDLYKKYAPDEIRNRKNISEALPSDSEIITISLVGEMMGIDSETAWHSFVKKNYSHAKVFVTKKQRMEHVRRKKRSITATKSMS